MKIKSLFFKAPEPKLKIKKNLSIYISEKHSEIIFAPVYKETNAGYTFEQETCEVIGLNDSPEIIGETFKKNFNKFDLKKRQTVSGKKSDWPAFKASKEKTIVGFEKNYIRFSISGVNENNLFFEIKTSFNYPTQIELITTISAYCSNSDLGKRLLKIYNSDISERK